MKMAHQAYALPWQTLADNLKYVHSNPRYHGLTNLYPLSKPAQGKQLQHFAKVFARVLNVYSAIERKKYDEEYSPPAHDDDILISDATAKNINNVVKEFMKVEIDNNPSLRDEPLSHRDRTMAPWMTIMNFHSADPNDDLIWADELLRTLLICGEMETLFRLAAHPHIRLHPMWTEDRKFAYDLGGYGFCEVKETALLAYICLNVFFLKPELYDTEMRQQMLKDKANSNTSTLPPDRYDYRLTSAYQQTVLYNTSTGFPWATYGAHKIPHREFFGVPFGMFTLQAKWHDRHPYRLSRHGQVPIRDLVDKSSPYQYIPNHSDIPAVISLLQTKKLPTELALQILEFADYTPKGRLPVRDDPLHIENAEELKKYLGYCWKLLVRTDMLLKANGSWLDWEFEVTEAIYKLFGLPYPQMSVVDRERNMDEDEINGGRTRRRFI